MPEMILPGEIRQVFPFGSLPGVAQPVAEGEIKGGSCSFNASQCRGFHSIAGGGKRLGNQVQQGQTAGMLRELGVLLPGKAPLVEFGVLWSFSARNNTANGYRAQGMIQTTLGWLH